MVMSSGGDVFVDAGVEGGVGYVATCWEWDSYVSMLVCKGW
jgi:hypothetical protein